MAGIVCTKKTATIYVGDSEALTATDRLVHMKTFTVPQSEAEMVDVTDFDSDGKEEAPGLTDYGELQITQHLTADEYDNMQTRQETGDTVYFQYYIHNMAGEVIVGRKGKGFVKNVNIEGVEVGGAITIQTTIRVTGKPNSDKNEPTEA